MNDFCFAVFIMMRAPQKWYNTNKSINKMRKTIVMILTLACSLTVGAQQAEARLLGMGGHARSCRSRRCLWYVPASVYGRPS